MSPTLSHIDIISKNLVGFFNSGHFLDISLSVIKFSIKCNRLMLAASSDYFRALIKFDENAMLRTEFILEADYLTPRGVQHAIKFIHSLGSDYENIPVDAYRDVYAASSFLQVVALQQKVRDLIISNLTIDNPLCKLTNFDFNTLQGSYSLVQCSVIKKS